MTSDISGVAIASVLEVASPVAPPPRSVRAVLDLHGFTREQEFPWPLPLVWRAPMSRHLTGTGVSDDAPLVGNEELLDVLTARFRRGRDGDDGTPRYTCLGCPLCRLDEFITSLAVKTAHAVLDEQVAMRRADRAERAADRDARRRARETAKKRPTRRRRT